MFSVGVVSTRRNSYARAGGCACARAAADDLILACGGCAQLHVHALVERGGPRPNQQRGANSYLSSWPLRGLCCSKHSALLGSRYSADVDCCLFAWCHAAGRQSHLFSMAPRRPLRRHRLWRAYCFLLSCKVNAARGAICLAICTRALWLFHLHKCGSRRCPRGRRRFGRHRSQPSSAILGWNRIAHLSHAHGGRFAAA